MYTLTVNFQSTEELCEFAKRLENQVTISVGEETKPKPNKKAAAKKTAEPEAKYDENGTRIVKSVKEGREIAAKEQAEKKAAEEKGASEPQKPAKKAEKKDEAPKELTYEEDVRPVGLKLTRINGGRDKLMSICDSYGVNVLTEVPEDKLEELLAKLEAAIEELEG